MHIRHLSAAAFLALIVPFAVSAETISLTPDRDNTLIEQTNPANQLSNGQGDIFSGRTNQGAGISIRRGLIYFDIDASAIPDGATITGVKLTVRDIMGLNGDRTHSLRRVLQDWGEGTSFFAGGVGAPATEGDATWLYTFYNATNPALSPTWDTPGGDFSSTVSGSTLISDDFGGLQFFSWSSSTPGNEQMIADVQSWLDNPAANFGWAILGDESVGQTAKRLNSSESPTFTPPGVAPVLEVTYVVPEPSSFVLAALGAMLGLAIMRRRRCN
ncbi:MAG: PEP-CTERM sorting domain-containing protein [Pirellulales bacterium]|nr:PEP-CTERM sorting domain-containing protein [Pirellulales bacterium]